MDKKVITKKQDLTHLSWTKIRRSSGTGGSFLKATEQREGKKWYYKLSDYDAYHGIIGHECVNEIIADRLLTLFHIPHVSYQLIHADVRIEEHIYETWVCRSPDFKRPEERKLALDVYYQLERKGSESPLEFCIRQGWGEYIWQMLVVDFLILNRDRHGANMEVLQDPVKQKVRLAPLFDHGLSFFFSAHTEKELPRTEKIEDKPVQCFVGGRSAGQNLELIPEKRRKKIGVLSPSDKDVLFRDLEEVLPGAYRDAIWKMLWKRWSYYESFCDTR